MALVMRRGVYLAFAPDKSSDKRWIIVGDEPTVCKRLPNTVCASQWRNWEESFLDLKSNGFQLEAARLHDKPAPSGLCGVIALVMLFLILQGVEVVESGNRRRVDAQWQHGMSCHKRGWNWICLCLTRQWQIQVCLRLPSAPDPQSAMALSKRH